MGDNEFYRGRGRRSLLFAIGGLGSVLTGTALVANRENDKAIDFYSSADENINAAVEELKGREYEALDVSSEGLHIETEMNEVIFNLGFDDVFEYGEEDVIETLSQGEYLDEGADFFGVVADNLADTDRLEYITLRFEAGLEDQVFEYRADVDDFEGLETRDDYEEFYRNNFEDEVYLGL